MSKVSDETICQSLVTLSHDEVRPFIVQLLQASSPTNTQLTPELLALIMASWPADAPLAVVVPDSLREAQQLLGQVTAWQTSIGSSTPWHLLTNSLSDQEWQGTITTALSLSYHALLSQLSPANFILIGSATDLVAPDPLAYQSQITHLQVGQSLSMHALVQRLVEQGYTRFESTIEPGAMRVRAKELTYGTPCGMDIIRSHFLVILLKVSLSTMVSAVP